jgi:hypothetical protein
MTDSAHCADRGCERCRTRLRLIDPLSLRRTLSAISVIVLAIELAGCARDPSRREANLGQQEVRTKAVRLASRPRPRPEGRQHVDLRVRRPDPALLAPQPAPNCEFKRGDIKAVDPDEWARLKTEYERQCYQDAEKAARDPLGQLQVAGICDIERVPATTARPAKSAQARPKP